MGELLHLPPTDHNWTAWERQLFEDVLHVLAQGGVDATRYEWHTAAEVWCTFRSRDATVAADVGRFGCAYHVRWGYDKEVVRAVNINDALELIVSRWRTCA